MILALDLQPQQLYSTVHELIRMVFPEYEIRMGAIADADGFITLHYKENAEQVVFSAEIRADGIITEDRQEYQLKQNDPDRKKQLVRLAKVFTYHLLCQHSDRNINPYGILTGVRPVKIVHRLIDQGYSSQQIIERLQSEYLMAAAKARLLTEIAINNRPCLCSQLEAKPKISIYIGIPYCPSRCYYCSFPGAVLTKNDTSLTAFLAALRYEMNGIGECIKDLKLEVENIYIGGGTPSILAEADLEKLFAQLQEKFISPATREITIEAGRPDTLSPRKMALFKEAGVNRICINPQTMQDATLKLIGRGHQASDIRRAVEWAKEAGIENINMDLIVGLPGEDLQANIITGQKILALKPENITVHSLAVKKGSQLAESEGKSGVSQRVEEVKAGIEYFSRIFAEHDYLPYYMYRQKYIKASLENTAYSLPGHFCSYNIQVMEERQTILGLGGAASSKFVNPADWTLTNLHNPKDPLSYCRKVDTLLSSKVDKLRALN